MVGGLGHAAWLTSGGGLEPRGAYPSPPSLHPIQNPSRIAHFTLQRPAGLLSHTRLSSLRDDLAAPCRRCKHYKGCRQRSMEATKARAFCCLV